MTGVCRSAVNFPTPIGEGTARAQRRTDAGYDRVRFVHEALPDLDHDKIDLGVDFLGRRLKAPLMLSVATRDTAQAEADVAATAEAAQHLGVAVAVTLAQTGSDRSLRRRAPDTVILATMDAAQLIRGLGEDEAQRVIDQIDADGLLVVLNPLKEACRPEGDRDWWGVGAALEALIRRLDRPVAVKAESNGLSGRTARRLIDMGAAALDVSGTGVSDGAWMDGERTWDRLDLTHAAAFVSWGAPTIDALIDVRGACPEAVIIGSGGVNDGVDVAKAIRLGADLVGMSNDQITGVETTAEAVAEHFHLMLRQLRTVCFCTNSSNLAALRHAPVVTFG